MEKKNIDKIIDLFLSFQYILLANKNIVIRTVSLLSIELYLKIIFYLKTEYLCIFRNIFLRKNYMTCLSDDTCIMRIR